MSSIATRTVNGSNLQTVLFTGRPFTLRANTTLNEKLNILSGEAPSGGAVPTLKAFGLGTGAHDFAYGADSAPVVTMYEHDPTDAALFKQIPFIMRPIASDLSPTLRAKYALRKQITVGSAQYFAYYLKRIDFTGVTTDLELETISNGTSTITTFVPSSSNLSPAKDILADDGSNPVASQFVNVRETLSLALTANDCAEIRACAALLYGDEKYAIISEMCLVTGVDRSVTIAGSTNFNELVAAQISAFVKVFHVLPYLNGGTAGTYDVGSNEPLLRIVV